MSGPIVGVSRAVLDFDDEDSEIVTTGNLWSEPPEGQMIVGTVVLYTLDLGRLRGMLDAARAGATNDDILLALDAAALGDPEDDNEPEGLGLPAVKDERRRGLLRRPYPGGEWRFSAFGRPSKVVHHPPIRHASTDYDGPTVFDELVVDDWFHVEAMDERVWWVRVGPVVLTIRVRADGTHDILVEEDTGGVLARWVKGVRSDD